MMGKAYTHGVGGPKVQWHLFGQHSFDQHRRRRRCCASKYRAQEIALHLQPEAAGVSLNLVTYLPWLASENL